MKAGNGGSIPSRRLMKHNNVCSGCSKALWKNKTRLEPLLEDSNSRLLASSIRH